MFDAIRCEHLTKRFANRAAVEDLTLSVQEGEVFGFLGPNGAGKTTTIRMLLGLVRPDAGTFFVFGDPVPCPQRLQEIGAMVEEPAFYPWLSGRENLQVLLDTGAEAGGEAVAEALDTTGLTEVATRKVKTYSQGMRQRLGLAAALLRKPRLLVLDEPANGLDPAGIRQVRDLLRSLGDQGVTAFLSSHLLGEVERICDRVAIIDRGRLVAVGSATELGGSVETRVKIAVSPEDHESALRLLGGLAVEVSARGTFLVSARSGREVNEALARGGVFAETVGLERSGLEEQFFALTQGNSEREVVSKAIPEIGDHAPDPG